MSNKGTKGSKSGKGDKNAYEPRISNRRALFDYHIIDRLEAGIALVGSEVKSVRKGHVQLQQSFARIRNGQIELLGSHIDEYEEANQFNHDPTRTRKLLMHKREILKLTLQMKKHAGSTLIPLEFYFKRGIVKVCLALAIGKKQYDKRQAIKEREDKRNMDKALKRR